MNDTFCAIIWLIVGILLIYVISNKKECKQDYENFNIQQELYMLPMRNGFSWTDDSLFTNLDIYENDPNVYFGGKSGIEKCTQNCQGNCVEFGITGKGFCFPQY